MSGPGNEGPDGGGSGQWIMCAQELCETTRLGRARSQKPRIITEDCPGIESEKRAINESF